MRAPKIQIVSLLRSTDDDDEDVVCSGWLVYRIGKTTYRDLYLTLYTTGEVAYGLKIDAPLHRLTSEFKEEFFKSVENFLEGILWTP